ncbi:MAG TPA: EVE domain-containing protein [Urbifossiella sp.]|nr:EVE domain-containing protein [Urbifossiella sp.]
MRDSFTRGAETGDARPAGNRATGGDCASNGGRAHRGGFGLTRDKKTIWDGVSNASAQKYPQVAAKGDRVFLYHTGDEKSVVCVIEVTVGPTPDPSDEAGKKVFVRVKPVKKLANPVSKRRSRPTQRSPAGTWCGCQ